MFCPNCGFQISDDARFCEQCGASLNSGGMRAEGSVTKNSLPNGREFLRG